MNGLALSKRERTLKLGAKRIAELTRANEALRPDAEPLSLIATQREISTAGHNFMTVMTLIAERPAWIGTLVTNMRVQ
jgi:hypothetical protein